MLELTESEVKIL